jgi:hypothetical protein
MAGIVSFEHVKELTAQLPPTERLKLMAHICEQLSDALPQEWVVPPIVSSEGIAEERARQEQLTQVNAWLAECDKVAELWEGEFDSAADLRRIRDEG